ncbi:hypothetical protein JW921_07565 [Candidatus Fermentibacterales bacterium]|nr:hypothetical protein [Candidatus Fermentibacterales bacterium]
MPERTSRAARAQMAALRGRGLLVHASSALVAGRALLFLAPSGGGKSTLAGRLHVMGHQAMGDDETALIIREDGRIDALATMGFQVLFGRPLEVKCAPLAAVCFLEKGRPIALVEVGKTYALYRLFRSLWTPGTASPESVRDLTNAGRIVERTRCVIFRWPLEEDPSAPLEELARS